MFRENEKKKKKGKDFYQRLKLNLYCSVGNFNQFIIVLCYFPSLGKWILKNKIMSKKVVLGLYLEKLTKDPPAI